METSELRELDVLVATRVLGKRLEKGIGQVIGWINGKEFRQPDYLIDPDDETLYLHVTDGYTGMVRYYSTVDFLEIVEWLKLQRGHLEIGNRGDEWWVNLPITPDKDPCSWKIYGEGNTIGIAVCNAAIAVANEK